MAEKTEKTDTANELQAQLDVQSAEKDLLADQLTKLSAGLIEREVVETGSADEDGFDPVEVALKAIGDLRADCDALSEDLASAKRSLTAQKGATTRAKASIQQLEEAKKPRALGAMKNTLEPEDLRELIENADLVEIAFSDGKREIPGLPPQHIAGDAWRTIAAGLKLEGVPLSVSGPAPGAPVYNLAGFALLLDGEQVAWGARATQRPIGPGQTYNLADDVVFQRPVEQAPEEEAA